MATSLTTNPETLVTLKINIEGSNRRFKLPLKDLGASTLPDKLRDLLAIPPTSEAIIERYSDSAAAFITLDSNNASVYKQLYRAAKAKLKLRLKVTVIEKESTVSKHASVEDEMSSPTEQLNSKEYPSPPASPALMEHVEQSMEKKDASMLSADDNQQAFQKPILQDLPKPQPDVSSDWCGRSIATSSHENTSSCNNEIPVTHGQTARRRFFAELAGLNSINAERQALLRAKCGPPVQQSTYSVYCNQCQDPIPDQHYHCSTCEDGDYDLCQACIDGGILCGGEGHWMIKRFVKNGKVINSTTETLPPRKSFSEFKTSLVAGDAEETSDSIDDTRTCNSCIQELSEEHFVTCTSCDDYDLCLDCHIEGEHGHHPKHAFEPVVEDADLTPHAKALLQAGRNAEHYAICDGCDKMIYGVRHKCLDCPDWDYCSECIINAGFIHPRHRFAPLYEPLGEDISQVTFTAKIRHHGIFCDGPLCCDKAVTSDYIQGDRYKCAVCHDTDFCASCEASPSNQHNKTHPLIKFKTPVRNVSVTTMGDHDNGRAMPLMGDRRTSTLSRSTETTAAPSVNAATQVQTVADLQPTEIKLEELEASSTGTTVAEPVENKSESQKSMNDDLIAHFVRDTVQDGTVLPPNSVFEQTWVLRNDGTTAWPAGCTVKFVGGDNMCAVDPEHPASVHELVSAAESTTCYTEVAPGQEFGFTVLMRTPNRSGKVISYWRLTGPSGNRFGHRLWCDVSVSKPLEAPMLPKEIVTPVEEPKEEMKNDVEHSQMIFPKLENESPVTSIHKELSIVEHSVVSDDLTDEDFESAHGFDDDETEDGFLTDEEYDILDASDEEYLAEQNKGANK